MRDIVPIKTYEYMSMGNSVISTKLPGIVKEFGNNNGVIFINESKEALEKVIELIQNKEISNEGLKAKNFAEKTKWEDVTNKFENLLEVLI